MKFKNGELKFEKNDILTIDNSAGRLQLIAKNGHVCSKCELCIICDGKKDSNLIAGFCQNIHFELER